MPPSQTNYHQDRPPPADPPRSAYVHIPFCAHRCGYCNFTLVARRPDLVQPYLRAIERELRELDTPRRVDTLYVGGGTPSQLKPRPLRHFLQLVRHWFPTDDRSEFSVEANPADVTREFIETLAEFGVTRISLGAQSFDSAKLKALERDHCAHHIDAAIGIAREYLETVSLDLIFAVPGESLAVWRTDLQRALALKPDHLSTYSLTYEKGTTFWSRRRRGQLDACDEALEHAMYVQAIDTLVDADFKHYEISSFARPGRRCRHNEVYWSGGTYYAIGPGAARHVGGRREMNHRSTTTYLKRVLSGRSPVAESEALNLEDAARERLVFGLRRLDGIDREQFRQQTGYRADSLGGGCLRQFVEQGLFVDDGKRIRLTRRGLMVSDSIWPFFLYR